MYLCSNKRKTNFSDVNNPLCSKINHFLQLHKQPGNWKSNSIYYEFDCFLRLKNKVITERTHPNGRGPKGINGRQPRLQVDTKGCSSGASEVGSEERVLLSTNTREAEAVRLKAWLHRWVARAKYNHTFPDNCNVSHTSEDHEENPLHPPPPNFMKKFDSCAWLTWRNNKFSKENLFSK